MESFGQQPPQFNIDITQTTPVTCEECGGEHFVQVSLMRRLSPMLSPTGQPALIPLPVYACHSCGHVNKEFMPPDDAI
jgi:uncharacterized Zn finger protein